MSRCIGSRDMTCHQNSSSAQYAQYKSNHKLQFSDCQKVVSWKYSTPSLALAPRVDFCILHINFKLLSIFALRKWFGVDNMAFWAEIVLFWRYVAFVCIVYIDVSSVHWQTIYCEKSTKEETGHFTLHV